MRRIYNVVFTIFFLLSSPYYYIKMVRRGSWREGFPQRFGKFSSKIKQALTNWRLGQRRTIGDRDYIVLQGSGARGLLATLYFDPQSGLLTRLVRYGPSPVGRVPTQIDYSDYRDVGGIKFPFELKFSWLDGRYTAKLKEIKTNVAIDPARFAKP